MYPEMAESSDPVVGPRRADVSTEFQSEPGAGRGRSDKFRPLIDTQKEQTT